MTSEAANIDRERLASNAKRFWAALRSDGPEAANQVTDESDAIVGVWRERGGISESLEPLLESEDIEIRYLAASYLATIQMSDRAYSILEEIGAGPFGAVSASAELLVMLRRHP
jgi:hypothetical protein